MLAFYINNEPLLLDMNTSVRITWANPACFFDSIPGDVALGLRIPVNEVNRMLLGNPERFEKYNSSSSREIEGFEIRYSGKLLIGGTLVIQTASNKQYSGWVRSNVGNLGKEHREKYIYEIPSFNEDVSFTNKADYDPDTDAYGCPEIYNPYFFKEKGRKKPYYRWIANPDWWPGSDEDQFEEEEYESEIITEGFRKYAYWRVNKRNPDNTVYLGTFMFAGPDLLDYVPITVVSPMLFLNFTLDKIFRDAHFFIDENALADDDDLKRLIIYNNYDITRMGFGATEELPFNSPWNDEQTNKARGFAIEFVFRDYNDTFRYKDLLPKVQLKDFLLGIQNLVNVCFHFRPDRRVNIIDRESIITGGTIDIDPFMLNEWEMGEKKDVTLKFMFKHDDDDTLFQERWEDVEPRREDEKEPVANFAALDSIEEPTIGEVRYLIENNTYVQYMWYQLVKINQDTGDEETTDMLGWKHIAIGFQNGYFNTEKEDEETIETVFSTLQHNVVAGIPEVQQPGNIKSTKYAYENFSPRLLFYTGNNGGNYETDTYSIDWEKKDTGLIASRWIKWAKFWSQRQPVTGEANLPINALDYIINNITSKFRHRGGEFIIEELETEFTLNKIGVTTIRGYKSDFVPNVYDLMQHWARENLIMMDEQIDFTGFDNLDFDII